MNDWNIKFYKNSRSDSPVEDFIDRQDAPTYAKILRLIDALSKHGPNLGMPYSKYLGDGLLELRVVGKNNVRIFYIFYKDRHIYLLHAFKKKTQKTPIRELRIAINRKKELTKI